MALKEKVPLRVALRKNTNVKSAGYQKWYAEVVLRQGLTQRGLIDHILEHIPGVPKSQITTVIATVAQCLPELVGQGISVKLDGIGVFYPTVNAQKLPAEAPGGPKSYTKTQEQMANDVIQPADVVRGIRFRFRPDSTRLDNLTSKKFKDKTSIELAGVFVNNGVGFNTVLVPREDYLKSLI